MERFICPSCGNGEIRRMSIGGRKMPFRQFLELEIPSGVEAPVCAQCGALWMDQRATEDVARALESECTAQVLRRAQSALDDLRGHVSPRELEQLLGLPPGSLSKIRGGRETSASTAAALMLLAKAPKRIDELRALWR